jgi:hypothetical protein
MAQTEERVKRYRGAIILLGVIAVLAGMAFWDDYQTKKDEQIKATENRVLGWEVHEVNALTYVDRSKDLKVELQKQDNEWKIVSP